MRKITVNVISILVILTAQPSAEWQSCNFANGDSHQTLEFGYTYIGNAYHLGNIQYLDAYLKNDLGWLIKFGASGHGLVMIMGNNQLLPLARCILKANAQMHGYGIRFLKLEGLTNVPDLLILERN